MAKKGACNHTFSLTTHSTRKRVIVLEPVLIGKVNPYSGNPADFHCYHHTNPWTGNNDYGEMAMEYSDIYVKRIRQLSKERGFAINKLAKRAGINQSTVDNIVRGLTKDPRVSTLHKIALAFNMTLAEFLDFSELNDYSFADNEEDYI